jgi:hypothetical protein
MPVDLPGQGPGARAEMPVGLPSSPGLLAGPKLHCVDAIRDKCAVTRI